MKKLAVVSALVLFGLTGCSDTVTRRTTTYQETASNVPTTTVVTPGTTVVTPGTVLNDDGTTTTTRTTKRVERYETN